MPLIKIPTSFNLDIEFEVAEFHRRLLAWLLDVFIQVVYIIIYYKIFNEIDRNNQYARPAGVVVLEIIFWMPVIFYYLVFEVITNGQSIGKKIIGLRVVNENGGRASISQFIIRWLIRVSDLMIIILLLILMISSGLAFADPELRWFLIVIILLMFADIILVASSKKAQRLGDLLAHTIIVRTKAKGAIQDTVFLEVEDNYVPTFPQIMQLSDKDINAIKSILDTAHKKGDFQLASTAAEKIKNHLNITSAMNPFDFLATALKDYNYLSVK